MHSLYHRLALGLIITAGIINLAGAFFSTEAFLPTGIRIGQLLLGCALWGLIVWKVATSPRKAGLVGGIFFTCMFIFQTYLFYSAATSPAVQRLPGADYSVWRYLYGRVPLALAAVSCFWLRRLARK
ncbi:hypothetical protein [Roseimicrobium sp. ORNL1]|uniref:hypothetical protein n=1 Tax=Roseimicrobium sp. ORNL1 TaxID=2711231 RepID=UPI00197D15DC|nr:hypothetical protein [Roseimicrobium sp. ORNL1]